MKEQTNNDNMLDISKLNELYDRADEADKRLFAEMRSNILIVSGEHHRKIKGALDATLRNLEVNKSKRLMLTKNHTQKITSDIKDIFISQLSDFALCPRNENELSDVKASELANSVWLWGKSQLSWDDLMDRCVNSFVDVGEVCTKVFFDKTQGDIKGYDQLVGEDGNPMFTDAMGQMTDQPQDEFGNPHKPAPDKTKPIFFGKAIIEKLDAFNLLRHADASTMKESPVLIYRKMMDVKKAKQMFASDDEEMAAKITESANRTYKIFDSAKGGFSDSKGQVMIREYYFRKCQDYPSGYYYIATDNTVLTHGEIPFGHLGEIAFPIKHNGYDIIETCPRYSSPIRPLRPYQIEINRAASQQATHAVTTGDDKLILHTGATVSKGADLPGIRTIHVSGPPPTILAGRAGEQFVSGIEANIAEMYRVARLPENESSSAQVTEPQAELFKSVKQRARFSRPMARFERFAKENVETYIFLQQKYLPEDQVIRATGRSEAVNVSEFKNVDRSDFIIEVQPVSGDYHTMFGKQIELETISQYLGKDLPMEAKAALIRSFPYLNKEPVLKEMMIEYEAPVNMILAIDRGDEFVPNKYDDVETMLKRLYMRTRQADFKFIAPETQDYYFSVIQEYEKIKAQQEEAMLRAQKGTIPTSGGLVKVDYYVNDVNTKGNVTQKRATLPSDSVEWLIKTLEEQGISQDRLNDLPQQGAVDILGMIPPDAFLNPQMNQQNMPLPQGAGPIQP